MGLLIKLLLAFWAILQNIRKQEEFWALSCNKIVRSWQNARVVLYADAFLAMSKTFFTKENVINQSSCRSYILGGTSRLVEAKIPTNIHSYAAHILVPGFLSLWKELKGRG